MPWTIDVKPYLVPLGDDAVQVLSLWDFGPGEAISLPWPARYATYPNLRFEARRVSSRLMIDVGFNSTAALRLQTSSEVHCYLWSLLQTRTVEYDNPASAITAATWGIGAQLGIIGWSVDSEFTIESPAGLSAGASLGLASSKYDIRLLGLGLDALTAIKSLVTNASGRFDVDTLETIGTAQAELVEYLGVPGRRAELTPALIDVTVDPERIDLDPPPRFSDVLGSESYAAERLLRWETADHATADDRLRRFASEGLDRAQVQRIYRDVFELEPHEEPQSTHRDLAWAILHSGR